MKLDAKADRIAKGLADFKDAVKMSFEEVKKELNAIEEKLKKKKK